MCFATMLKNMKEVKLWQGVFSVLCYSKGYFLRLFCVIVFCFDIVNQVLMKNSISKLNV